MAESMFSIFPDGGLTSGHGLKGNVPRSKKKALCDVKNTIQSKRAVNEPLRKFNLELPSDGSSKLAPKDPTKDFSSKLALRQEGTFNIACDEASEDFWEKCGQCKELEDPFLVVRSQSDCLNNADLDYLVTGMFSLGRSEPLQLPNESLNYCEKLRYDDWMDIELRIPPTPPLDFEPATPLLLSDEE